MESEMNSLILLVHDDEKLLRTYSRLLKSRRRTVCAAKTGKEALAMALSSSPDLVLLGVVLPDRQPQQGAAIAVAGTLLSQHGHAQVPMNCSFCIP